ncbi:MAG: DUF6069 family protein [Actinomycetota bacterium]|jgi:hypothetical protein|nr:DUF6069 family protein [Actinomycetota bacterium]
MSSITSPATVRASAATTAAAVVTNLALLLLGGGAGATFTVPGRGAAGTPVQVGVGAVVASTVLPLVAGLLVTALVARRARRAVVLVRALAVLFTVGSLAFPLSTDTDTTTRLLLALMHLVVGGAYLAATRSGGLVPATASPQRLEAGGRR